MSIEITTHEHLPVVIAHWPEGEAGDPAEEVVDVQQKAREAIEAEGWPHAYVLYDLNTVELSFGDLVMGLSELRSDTASWLRERATIVIVGPPQLADLIASANEQEQYGPPAEIIVAASRDDALAQIEEREG